jgi:uncharacterized protein (DUF58 family)
VAFLRRLPLLVLAGALVVTALSTGLDFLYYLVYLGILVVGGSYLMTREGLSNLEAGYAMNQLQAHVGDQLRATYTLRNMSRLPKGWLEVHNPTTLPVPLPGRALSLGPRGERYWVARVPLTRRGHYRVDPLQIRTGDPFGFFEASASVGHGVTVVVYPRVEQIPRWRLQAVSLEGSRSTPVRTQQTTPLATSVRPYAPGDSFNRIHWPSTARTGEIQVKEFDLEQTADVWLILDLDRSTMRGTGDDGTAEVAIRVAAAIAERAISENRAVGLTVAAGHLVQLPSDRGPRQRQKVLDLLAAVDGDGETPLVEALVTTLPLLRRGMSALVITASTDASWVRPLTALRPRGIGCQVFFLDPAKYGPPPAAVPGATAGTGVGASATRGGAAGATPAGGPGATPAGEPPDQAGRNLRHALAEFDLRSYVVPPAVHLAEVLVG